MYAWPQEDKPFLPKLLLGRVCYGSHRTKLLYHSHAASIREASAETLRNHQCVQLVNMAPPLVKGNALFALPYTTSERIGI